MNSFLCSILLAIAAEPQQQPLSSYLYQPAYNIENVRLGPTTPYEPQPGDLMMHWDGNKFWAITHGLAGAFRPHGSGIVVARPDGTLGILEAGPSDVLWVGICDVLPHLKEYEDIGLVWIRRRKTPLTAEQSACLTDWAMKQEGKKFCLWRLGAQLTIFRTRGPLRTWVEGKPNGERNAYFCSELVTETLVAAGLIDAETARPSATYPHELFFDTSFNPYLKRHFSLACDWYPPARFTSCPAE